MIGLRQQLSKGSSLKRTALNKQIKHHVCKESYCEYLLPCGCMQQLLTASNTNTKPVADPC